MARAIWYTGAGQIELRTSRLEAPMPGQALVRTLYSGISRGTERLVLAGAVGASEHARMRAPLQEGEFPFPVKYGYCATGVVEAGPAELLGKTVFCLHPHQDSFVAPVEMLALIPEAVPARRATLAANMETALNALWDSGAGPADRIVVVGGGVVGLLIAYLAARLPGAEVTVIDVAGERRAIAESFGAGFVAAGMGSDPLHAPQHSVRNVGSKGSDPRLTGDGKGSDPCLANADVVFHSSVSAEGLNTAIACAGKEGTIVELSWYGDRETPVRLGGAFHSLRLKLISSQVGEVAASRRPRWDYRRRLDAALRLLDDKRLDQLVAEEISFAAAATELPRILAPGAPGFAPVIRYPKA